MDENAELESIVNSVEQSTNAEIPMESEQTQEVAQETAAPQTIQEYEFQTGGRTVKAPIEKILGWASQGYNAGNRIGQLSKQLEDYQAKSKQWENYEKTYKPIDEWAKQNPDKWQSLVSNWQQAQFGGNPSPEQAKAQVPPELIQKVQQFEERFQQFDQEKQIQKERHADQTLDGEINSIRKQFSNIDFDAPDKTGNSLEYQILEHATKNGIPSFRAAFRDYCFDQLNSFSKEKGREAASKSISTKTRSDLLGKDTSQERGRSAPNLKGMNYDQIHEMILATELGRSG